MQPALDVGRFVEQCEGTGRAEETQRKLRFIFLLVTCDKIAYVNEAMAMYVYRQSVTASNHDLAAFAALAGLLSRCLGKTSSVRGDKSGGRS
jgi:hypothetical protein